MWKVRHLNAEGEVAEASFDGSLADLVQAFDEASIVVIQRVRLPAIEAPKDKAEGRDSVTVEKG